MTKAAINILSLVVLWALAPLAPDAGAAVAKPNLILIFADDLDWKYVGFNGSDFYETPHLDRLAREGLVFNATVALIPTQPNPKFSAATPAPNGEKVGRKNKQLK